MTVQKRYSELSDAIADRLKIFNSLDPTIRKLNNADITFVETDEFKEMLKSLDQSLEFLSTHKQFHDSEFYYSHFRQCMTRSLTLIRLYLTASLDIDTHEEPYTVASYQLRPFAMEIEQRCQHQEYISLLKDCYAAYFSARQKFIAPMISKYIAGHVQEKHLVAFTRIILSYVRGILSDEFDLFFQFFDTGVEDLMTWFTYLLSPVYNHLRPRTIHQLDLSILCDLCILLQTQFIRDEEELITRVNEKVLDFGRLIRSVLQDAQTRVIFRTQQTIEKDIRKFMPTEPDLDYPAKLFERKQIQQDDEFDISHLLIGWYPTMRKSVWILSKIYRLVNSVVFDDLAHEITHVCTHSLISAAIRIAQLHSNTDSRLFLIHHLLLLKEQISAFDIEFIRPRVDIEFSWGGNKSEKLFSPSGILEFASSGIPRVVESMFDAKEELDEKLREAINGFTFDESEEMMSMFRDELCKEGTISIEEMTAASKERARMVKRKLEEYISDSRTREILEGAIKTLVAEQLEMIKDRAKEANRQLWEDTRTLTEGLFE
ncbi:Conserved oligomeric Golgi complex subunit 3 isoform B [Neolecta irregularis DAH-3]|nr:Conserved oligomeric Golgi complex subunit 3 isoform B [Neolecta irregularis DAH-3]|eukprot:OLL24999.1 Conserved oligomeric Golgi complex subunit 3 isoform B [Neolecta irregularis DAH-3]